MTTGGEKDSLNGQMSFEEALYLMITISRTFLLILAFTISECGMSSANKSSWLDRTASPDFASTSIGSKDDDYLKHHSMHLSRTSLLTSRFVFAGQTRTGRGLGMDSRRKFSSVRDTPSTMIVALSGTSVVISDTISTSGSMEGLYSSSIVQIFFQTLTKRLSVGVGGAENKGLERSISPIRSLLKK